MNFKASAKGFTLIEILVALGIMSIGFLAMAQMQYLSLRQAGLAESGTIATNIIELAANRDMQELKRLHLLNATNYLKAVRGTVVANPEYCSGEDATCTSCPCNPAEVLGFEDESSLLSQSGLLITGNEECAVLDTNNFDPANIVYHDSSSISSCENSAYYLIRRVDKIFTDDPNPTNPDTLTFETTYGIKNQTQFDKFKDDSDETPELTIPRTVALQTFTFSAHVDTNWDTHISSWNQVIIPHIP